MNINGIDFTAYENKRAMKAADSILLTRFIQSRVENEDDLTSALMGASEKSYELIAMIYRAGDMKYDERLAIMREHATDADLQEGLDTFLQRFFEPTIEQIRMRGKMFRSMKSLKQ